MKKQTLSEKTLKTMLVTSLAVTPVLATGVTASAATTTYQDVDGLQKHLAEIYPKLSADSKTSLQNISQRVQDVTEAQWKEIVKDFKVTDQSNKAVSESDKVVLAKYVSKFVYAATPSELGGTAEEFKQNAELNSAIKRILGQPITVAQVLNFGARVENNLLTTFEGKTANELKSMTDAQYKDILTGAILDAAADDVSLAMALQKSVDLSNYGALKAKLAGVIDPNNDLEFKSIFAKIVADVKGADNSNPGGGGTGGGGTGGGGTGGGDTGGGNTGGNTPTIPSTPDGGIKVDPLELEKNVDGVVAAIETKKPEELKEVVLELGSTTPSINLPAKFLEAVGTKNSDAVFTVATTTAAYHLPVAEIKLADLAKSLGVEAKDVTVKVTVTEGIDSSDVLSKNKLTSVSPIIDFNIVATANGKEVAITRFADYVERDIKGKSDFSPSHATVVRLNVDGTVSPIPTVFDKNTAHLFSITNSQYTVIENDIHFKDVPKTNRFQANIEKLANKLVIAGYKDGTYHSDDQITRAQLASLISRALGLTPSKAYDGSFSDIKGNEWFAKDVFAAAEAGIVVGKKDGRFATQEKVTRAEAAAMMNRAMKFVGYSSAKVDTSKKVDTFKDSKTFKNSFAAKDIEAVYQLGVMNGQDDGRFDPNGKTTRGQMARMLDGSLQVVDFINK